MLCRNGKKLKYNSSIFLFIRLNFNYNDLILKMIRNLKIERNLIVMSERLQFFINIFFMCHQRPDRSFFYKGRQFPVCARCTGLGVGYILSMIVLIFLGMLQLWLIALLVLPMAIDGTGQLFHKWESNNIRRFITGTLAGIGILYVLYYFLYQGFLFGRSIGTTIFN